MTLKCASNAKQLPLWNPISYSLLNRLPWFLCLQLLYARSLFSCKSITFLSDLQPPHWLKSLFLCFIIFLALSAIFALEKLSLFVGICLHDSQWVTGAIVWVIVCRVMCGFPQRWVFHFLISIVIRQQIDLKICMPVWAYE